MPDDLVSGVSPTVSSLCQVLELALQGVVNGLLLAHRHVYETEVGEAAVTFLTWKKVVYLSNLFSDVDQHADSPDHSW